MKWIAGVLVVGSLAAACSSTPVDESAFVSFNEPSAVQDGDTYVMRSQDFVLAGRVLSRDSTIVDAEPGFEGASCCVRIDIVADRPVFRNPDGLSYTDRAFGFTTENSKPGCTDVAYDNREDVCFVRFATTAVQLPLDLAVTFTATAYEGRAKNAGFAVQEITVKLDPDVVIMPVNYVYATTGEVSESSRRSTERRIVNWIDGDPGDVDRLERTGRNSVERTLHWRNAEGFNETIDWDPVGFPVSGEFPQADEISKHGLHVQFQLASLEFHVDDYIGRYFFGPDQRAGCNPSGEPFSFLKSDSPVVSGSTSRRDLGGVLVIETNEASRVHGLFANVSCGPAALCAVGSQNFIALNRSDRASLGSELSHAIGLDHSTARCGEGLYDQAETLGDAYAALEEYVGGIVCGLGESKSTGYAGFATPSRCP